MYVLRRIRVLPYRPIVGWLEEIDATLARSPGFVGKPVVLDLSAVDLSQSATPIRRQPRATQYPVLGIEGGRCSTSRACRLC
jgi:septum site-determining protein MinC